MDREAARQTIRRNWRQLIPGIAAGEARTRVNGETSYICPIPGCGHGTNGDGLTRNPRSSDGNGLKCFSCGFSGDIIDLYQQTTGADYNTALKDLAQELGITIDPYRPIAAGDFQNEAPRGRTGAFQASGNNGIPPERKSQQSGAQRPPEAQADYTAYYQTCRAGLKDPAAVAYLKGRGISAETAERFWIGFDPAADPASAPGAIGADQAKAHPVPRLILPTGPGHYVARRIDGGKDFAKLNPKGSRPEIFNERALFAQDVQAVFVVEGIFDALSIIEAGGEAVALSSTSNVGAFLKALEKRRSEVGATLVLCLDNDSRGKQATETLRAGLDRLNVPFITADICGVHKDPNEYLTADRAGFSEAIERAQLQTAAKPDNVTAYIDQWMTADLARFRTDKKTGFENLDKAAGGLYPGLYVLAAISSLGKTSFALQIADQLAERGNDVIFFSLEQSRLELVTKSLARRTAQADPENAVTSLSIRKGYLPARVLKAAEDYKTAVSDRLSIVEGNFGCNVSFIGDYIRRYIRRNGSRPVVFVDYLQILQPSDEMKRQSTKEIMDFTVTELKRLSRELDLTMIIISSVNRANYLTPIDFESLKESGSIEFTADVIWGLQLQCLNDPLFDKQTNLKEKREKIKEAKRENPRKIELSCLKNRYGIANYSCYFDYFPANDLFKACAEAEADFTPETDQKQRTGTRRL